VVAFGTPGAIPPGPKRVGSGSTPFWAPGARAPNSKRRWWIQKKTRWRIQKQDGGFKGSILPALHALLASTLLLLLPPCPPVLIGLHACLHFPEEGIVFIVETGCGRNVVLKNAVCIRSIPPWHYSFFSFTSPEEGIVMSSRNTAYVCVLG